MSDETKTPENENANEQDVSIISSSSNINHGNRENLHSR